MIRFENPLMLHWLWALPVLGVVFLFFMKRYDRVASTFIEAHLLDQVAVNVNHRKRVLKYVFLSIVYVASVVSLARPQWGYHMETIKREGVDILIAVDVSKSMLTQDVKPSRLTRTKLGIKDIVKKLHGDRIGLIAFAGESFLMCPLTNDYNGFLMTVDDLSTDSIPRGGTNLAKAIEEAVKDYGDQKQTFKAVVIITDGEEEQGNAKNAARLAKEKGIRLYTIGVGTKEGDLVQVTDEQGTVSFLKDAQGNFIKSRLNESLLQEIAYTTNGAYVRSGGGQFGLDYVYDEFISKLEKKEMSQKEERRYHERFQWPLTLAFVMLVGYLL